MPQPTISPVFDAFQALGEMFPDRITTREDVLTLLDLPGGGNGWLTGGLIDLENDNFVALTTEFQGNGTANSRTGSSDNCDTHGGRQYRNSPQAKGFSILLWREAVRIGVTAGEVI